MGIAIGIDLGTTNSAIAVVRPDGRPEILKNREGAATTPSVVLFQDFGGGDEPLVGEQAKRQAGINPTDVVQHVKRYMGDASWRFDSESGAQYSPEEVSAIVLKRLKEDAELALGASVTDAVITVPAYFDDSRRIATKHAGQIAGLNVLRVLNEPTAAALSYGVENNSGGHVLVYDLGGGTFDVTILRIAGAEFEVVATDGDRNLGGFDFDNALMNYLNDELKKQGAPDSFEDVSLMVQLREQAEDVKKSLSTVPATNAYVTIHGRSYRVPVNRGIFDAQIAGLLRRTEEILEDVLQEAQLTWAHIDKVLLVGGSTRMPAVRQMLEKVTGKTPELGVNPDEAVALGAAIRAALESEPEEETIGFIGGRTAVEGLLGGPVRVKDVTSQALGAILFKYNTDEKINRIIIPRNSEVPAKHNREVYTRYNYQESILVTVTQGDDEDPEFVTIVGKGVLDMPIKYPKGAPLEYIYKYDVDQIINVEVIDVTANISLGTFQIDRVANLTQEQIEKANYKIGSMMIM